MFDPKYTELLKEHLLAGWSFSSFSGKINVNDCTLHRWIREFPEFKEAKLAYHKVRDRRWPK